jgi:hypothetical protein
METQTTLKLKILPRFTGFGGGHAGDLVLVSSDKSAVSSDD